MKYFKLKLIYRILIAILLGVALGQCMPTFGIRIFATFNSIFSEYLSFLIPLIILGLVAPAIADLGTGAGRMLLATVGIAYASTILSGFFSLACATTFFPRLIDQGAIPEGLDASQATAPFFSIDIPPCMSVMTALVLAFLLGITSARIKGQTLRNACADLREVMTLAISRSLIPLLPTYIFGIFLIMTAEGKVSAVLGTFIHIIGVILVMHVILLLFQFSIAGLVQKRNPLKLLATMLPAYVTALGTSSSAATIPITLRQTLRNGVSESTAQFTVPLCATIHLAGSILKITATCVAMMLMQGHAIDTAQFTGFIFMLAITMVASPGVPGGAIMAALGVITTMLGFGEAENALIIALYIAIDSIGTATNVTGDGAIALIVDHIFSKNKTTSNPSTQQP